MLDYIANPAQVGTEIMGEESVTSYIDFSAIFVWVSICACL